MSLIQTERGVSFYVNELGQLFERWITPATGYISIQLITQLVSLILIHSIVIYPLDSTIQRLNNRDLYYKFSNIFSRALLMLLENVPLF